MNEKISEPRQSARVACCVPFCGRTTSRPYSEWICSNHWRLVPKRKRQLYSLAKRRRKPESVQAFLWSRCKVAAIQAAGGIG